MAMLSPFAEQEKARGAVLAERFGVLVPEHYGDPAGEYEAVRKGVGLVDMSWRGVIELTGTDRIRWLNGQITNDVKDLKAGEGTLAAVLNVKGHILADLAVYGLSDSVWIDLSRDRAQIVRDAFDRYIVADDVVAENASDRYAHLMVVGPEAQPFMVEAAGAGMADLPAWHHAQASLGSSPARIIASRWLGMPGHDVIVPAAAAGEVWEALMNLGAGRGLCPVGMAALEILRVEAGWPWFGVDFDEGNLLMESLTRDHVSFTKGCYIGQEVVIRVEHQGHVNKRLCGLRVAGEAVPPVGAGVQSGERTVGTVTSAVRSPMLGRVIALGYVRRDFWDPGTKLRIVWGEQSLEAEVAPPPFISEGL
ncbi:MAG: aminomethyl transferase family protein [candidate division NC10 bacterium]|nr:aminomethyl transferase family protein [candidate division NC10 bacterium]